MNQTALKACVLIGAVGAFAGLVSVYTTPLCACASPAQVMLGLRWAELDAAALGDLVKRRFPAGMSAGELRERIGAYYSRCETEDSGRRVSCTLPSDRNAWRERHARLAFRFDSDDRLVEAAITHLTR